MRKTLASLALVLVLTLSMLSGAASAETLTFMSNNLGHEDILQKYIDQWNAANADTQIELVMGSGTPDEYWGQLSTAFAGGEGYDIFMMSPSYFQEYIDNDMCYVLDDWFKGTDGWYDYAINDVTRDGHIYAFPAFNDLMGMYVNLDMLAECGITEVPNTWDEVIETAKTVANKLGVYGFVNSITFEGYGQFEWYPILWSTGADFLTDEGVIKNRQGVVDALSFWRNISNSEGGCLDTQPLTDYFINKLMCMYPVGQWALNDLENPEKAPDFKWTVVAYPTQNEGDTPYTVMGGWKHVVYSKGKDPKRAADFLKWLMNDTKFQADVANGNLKWAPKKSVVDTEEVYNKGGMKMFKDNIIAKANVGMEPSYNSLELSAIGDALEAALFDTSVSIDSVVDTLEKTLTDLQK